MNNHVQVPTPSNEPVFPYNPGDAARAELKTTLAEMSANEIEIPIVIGGEEFHTGDLADVVLPHQHQHRIARYHRATPELAQRAVNASLEAHRDWAHWNWEDRVAVFLRAAELLSTTWRSTLNAATMLGQSKTAHQAEIDAACELIDFLRFNAQFAQQIYSDQPNSSKGVWNQLDYRPLEGFIYAISPFNFTAIGGNLTGAPAMVGNTIVWKPSHAAVLSSYHTLKLFEEAGLPPGVMNFIPGNPVAMTKVAVESPHLAGVHFTGSTGVFQGLWQAIGSGIAGYRSYPRLVGETGGKNFIIAHPSADPSAVVTAIVRGAFEYQGQKCSAASRAYIPESVWGEIKDTLVEQTEGLTMGDPADFRNFMSAVIHDSAYGKITEYIDAARSSNDVEFLAGGDYSDDEGWFIRPTLLQAKRPDYRTMCEEIFGPVMTVFVYPDGEWDQILQTVDETSPYALTGAVFSRNQKAALQARKALRYAAGNFYINDKPTGAVVGQQPFGGSRASGTNDKAGSSLNLLRWMSPRTIKETQAPPSDYRYPFMDAE